MGMLLLQLVPSAGGNDRLPIARSASRRHVPLNGAAMKGCTCACQQQSCLRPGSTHSSASLLVVHAAGLKTRACTKLEVQPVTFWLCEAHETKEPCHASQQYTIHWIDSWLGRVSWNSPLTAKVGCIRNQKAELTWLKMSFPCFTFRKNWGVSTCSQSGEMS